MDTLQLFFTYCRLLFRAACTVSTFFLISSCANQEAVLGAYFQLPDRQEGVGSVEEDQSDSYDNADVDWTQYNEGAPRSVVFSDDFSTSVRNAVSQSRLLGSLEEEYKATKYDVAATQSAGNIQINSSVGFGAQSTADSDNIDMGSLYSIGVSKILSDGGKLDSRLKAENLKSELANIERLKVLNQVTYSICVAWLRVWEAQELSAKIEQRQQFLDSAQLKLRLLSGAGIADRVDEIDFELLKQEFQLARELALKDLMQAELNFKMYYGSNPERLSRPELLFNMSKSSIDTGEILAIPEVNAARIKMDLALAQLDTANAEFIPNLVSSLGVSPNSSSTHFGEPDLNLGMNLTYKLGDGGRRIANVEAGKQRLSARTKEFEYLRKNSEFTLRSSLIELEKMQLSLKSLGLRKSEREDKIQALERQIALGASNATTLIQETLSGFKADDDAIIAENKTVERKLEIFMRLGLLANSFDLK